MKEGEEECEGERDEVARGGGEGGLGACGRVRGATSHSVQGPRSTCTHHAHRLPCPAMKEPHVAQEGHAGSSTVVVRPRAAKAVDGRASAASGRLKDPTAACSMQFFLQFCSVMQTLHRYIHIRLLRKAGSQRARGTWCA